MNIALLVSLLDYLGAFVFALSGASMAVRKNMDLLGIFILALVTAIGGGSLRSVLIGDFPVLWLKSPEYILLALLAAVLIFFYRNLLQRFEIIFLVFDAIGLGLCVSTGITIALSHGLAPWASLAMGVVSGCFGGVLRDVLANQVPLLFRKEIYATACILGGLLYLLIRQLGISFEWNALITSLSITLIRLFSVRFGLSLPKPKATP